MASMGARAFDEYSFLHFAVGIIARYWDMSPWVVFVAHVAFEWTENTHVGVAFINQYVTWWPGGKPCPDSLFNSIGDTAACMLGYATAAVVCSVGRSRGWYVPPTTCRV